MKDSEKGAWREAHRLFRLWLDVDSEEREEWLEELDAEPPAVEKLRQLIASDDRSGLLDQGLVAQPTPPRRKGSLIGRRVGQWLLEEEVGRGGMSVVYRGRRDADGFSQTAAVKLLVLSQQGAAGIARFERERQILAELNHPAIATMLDGGVAADGTPYLVMELVDGTTVDRHCQEQGLDLRARVELILQFCDAVSFAHRHLIVHRDLKPGNMLVDREGRPRLLDFGIARLIDRDGDATSSTQILTPGYAAPEQRAGHRITTATDVFGLGVVLYELIAGRRPFSGASDVAMPPPPPSTDSPFSIDRDLDNIALMALRHEPERRYASVEALAEDLRAWWRRKPVCATPPSPTYRLRKYMSRHRVGVATGAMVVLTAIAGFSSTVWQARKARGEAVRARVEAGRAIAVRDFLVGLFEAAKVGSIRDELPSTLELLEQGSKDARTAFSDQPAVRADMLTTLGTIFQTLARYDESEVLLGEALSLLTAMPSPDRLTLGQAQYRRGMLEQEQSRPDDAQLWLRSALETLDAAEPQQMRLRMDVHEAMVDSFERQGDPEAGLAQAQQAGAEVELHAPGDPELRARVGLCLAIAMFSASEPDFETMLSILRQARGFVEPLDGEDSLKLAIDSMLGSALIRLDRYEEAAELKSRALELAGRIYPEAHPSLGQYLSSMGVVQDKLGRYREAEGLYQRALEISVGAFDDDHLSVANARYNLGNLLNSLERPEEAEGHLRAARLIFEAAYGEDAWRTQFATQALASAISRQGRQREARALLEKSVGLAEQAGDENAAADANRLLSRLHLWSGAPVEARAAGLRALSLYRKLYPQGIAATASCLSLVGLSHAELGEVAQAEEHFKEGLDLLDRLGASGRDSGFLFFERYALFLTSQGRKAEADEMLRRALALAIETNGENHPTVGRFRELLVEVETGTERATIREDR